jgi:hypothetical protein
MLREYGELLYLEEVLLSMAAYLHSTLEHG